VGEAGPNGDCSEQKGRPGEVYCVVGHRDTNLTVHVFFQLYTMAKTY